VLFLILTAKITKDIEFTTIHNSLMFELYGKDLSIGRNFAAFQ